MDTLDPFAVLGLPRSFEIDEGTLHRAWLSRSAALHPDRAGDDEANAEAVADLNRARATLRDPERRANALLRLLGGPRKEEDRSLPDGLLTEMLEVREEMESDLAESGDTARAKWEAWAGERRAGHIERVGELFAGPATPESLREIRRELNAWRYTERMIEQLDPAYDPNRADFRG